MDKIQKNSYFFRETSPYISAPFDFCKYHMHATIPEDFDFVPDLGLGPGVGPLPCLGRGCGLALGFGLDLGQLLARCLVLLLRRLHL